MDQPNALIVFEGKNIRRTWFNDEWWFVAVDIISILTDSNDPSGYLKDIRRRDEGFAQGWGQIATPLPILTEGGVQHLNCISTKGALRLVQSIPSKKKLYEKIIDDATADCHDEEEKIDGWDCILEENIRTPCPCQIGKQQTILERISLDDNSQLLIGVIKLNKTKMRILLQDITLEDPEAMKYINAYKYWCKNGW